MAEARLDEELTRMHVSHEHVGPWIAEDVLSLPEDGTGNRHEVIVGALLVTPAPSYRHQRGSQRLTILLQRAAKAAGVDVEVMVVGTCDSRQGCSYPTSWPPLD